MIMMGIKLTGNGVGVNAQVRVMINLKNLNLQDMHQF